MSLSRRDFIKWASASAALASLGGCATPRGGKTAGRVVVIGGGYSGATAAKYLRLWSPDIDVSLVERNPVFVSCPLSNLVIGGSKSIADLTRGYDTLSDKYGVKRVQGEAVAVDPAKRTVRLADGGILSYDRLIVAPGIDFMFEAVPSLNDAEAQDRILHAWKAGPQTTALRRQLEAMPDGGIYALHIPKVPYRCPPGPYERACQVAHYFKTAKPRSKVLILDANEDVQSKKGLFMKAWSDRYKGIVEYRPHSELADVDVKNRVAKLTFEDVKADVLNVVPPQRAGKIADLAGLVTANQRWCEVDFLSFESKAQPNIHVLGDAILAAPAMPKSGHMANQHAKVCAAAVAALLHGQPVFDQPVVTNTCYSFIDDRETVHVASVHRYDPEQKALVTVPGSGGLSGAASEMEGQYAFAWAKNIWSDVLG